MPRTLTSPVERAASENPSDSKEIEAPTNTTSGIESDADDRYSVFGSGFYRSPATRQNAQPTPQPRQ